MTALGYAFNVSSGSSWAGSAGSQRVGGVLVPDDVLSASSCALLWRHVHGCNSAGSCEASPPAACEPSAKSSDEITDESSGTPCTASKVTVASCRTSGAGCLTGCGSPSAGSSSASPRASIDGSGMCGFIIDERRLGVGCLVIKVDGCLMMGGTGCLGMGGAGWPGVGEADCLGMGGTGWLGVGGADCLVMGGTGWLGVGGADCLGMGGADCLGMEATGCLWMGGAGWLGMRGRTAGLVMGGSTGS